MPVIAFGPVPSRRLGRSLGVNNIPAKICSYGCVYCQIGRTLVKSGERQAYYEPKEIFRSVEKKLAEAEKQGVEVDYITFVPDGEPTLDINLGKEAEMLGDLGIKLAIITNSSLIWMEDVRSDLSLFDLVSMKLDAVSDDMWKMIDRPHETIEHGKILEGMLEFRSSYSGKLVTEAMLVGGVDYEGEIAKIAEFLGELGPDVAYISAPTRPPAEGWVKMPDETLLNHAFHAFSSAVHTEYLISYEGTDFISTGSTEEDIASIASVHPIREDALRDMLKRKGEGWETVEKMVSGGVLVPIEYSGNTYYMRKLPTRK